MRFVRNLYEFYRLVLFVMLFNIQHELLCVARVDGCRYPISSLGQQCEHSFINKVINQNNTLLCAAIDEVIDPLEKIPLAAPQARKLHEAMREAEDIYIKTTAYFEETEDAKIVRMKTDLPL